MICEKQINNSVIIRNESAEDYVTIEKLHYLAFKHWKDGKTCDLPYSDNPVDEHLLAHLLRKSPDFIPELSLVAELGGTIVGSIMYSKAYVLRNSGEKVPVITFGPLGVLPEYMKLGIGGTLMEASISLAKSLEYGAIIFYGHDNYYPRFGFVESKEFSITTPDEKYISALMAMELKDCYLGTQGGKFYETDIFNKLDPVKSEDLRKSLFI